MAPSVLFLAVFFAANFVGIQTAEENLCMNLVHLEDCEPTKNDIKFYNISTECHDGRNYLDMMAQLNVPFGLDTKVLMSIAQCVDYTKEDECNFLFTDIEADDICEQLADVDTGDMLYKDGAPVKELDCPLTGSYRLKGVGMFDKFITYLPRDKPYIFVLTQCYKNNVREACLKAVVQVA